MHKDEPVAFLRLAAAVKLLLARSVSDESINHGEQLLKEYLFDYKRVNFPSLSGNILTVFTLDLWQGGYETESPLGSTLTRSTTRLCIWIQLLDILDRTLEQASQKFQLKLSDGWTT